MPVRNNLNRQIEQALATVGVDPQSSTAHLLLELAERFHAVPLEMNEELERLVRRIRDEQAVRSSG